MQNMNHLPGAGFREYLRQELQMRSQINSRYSLRSFARTLGVSASGLSMMMAGKTPVTLSFIEKVAMKLKIADEKTKSFQLELLNEKSQSPFKLKNFEFIDEDRFAIIKEWYHYAILNLMRTKGFQAKPAWIARRLGITLPEAQSAVEKLQRVGLLQMKNGKWVDASSKFTSHANTKSTNEAARANQKVLFSKAQESIENDAFEKRSHSGCTIAFSTQDIEKARLFITKFRKEFMSEFDRSVNADEVYHLSVGLFSLTKLKD